MCRGIRSASILVGLVLLASCLLPQGVLAQAVSGTVLGSVKDPSGAVVAGAQVIINYKHRDRIDPHGFQ